MRSAKVEHLWLCYAQTQFVCWFCGLLFRVYDPNFRDMFRGGRPHRL